MSKTNIGLTEHAEKALKEAWYYLWGAYGQIASQPVLSNNIRQYSSNETWRNYAEGAIGKTRFCDCYGLLKSYLWWVDDNSNPIYVAAQDLNTSMAYNAAREKGTLSTLPEIPGIILYMTGHVGIYCGGGRFIECMGGGVGMYEGRIENTKIVKGSRFTNWFKDIHIEYQTKYKKYKKYKEKEEDELRYNSLDEIPDWARDTIQKLLDKGYLKSLDISHDMVRMFVVNDIAGLYD